MRRGHETATRARTGWLVLGLVLACTVACAPRQTGPDQCPDINTTVTANKDADYTDPIPEIDALVEAYMNANDIPGCSVGIMDQNEIYYIQGYGWRDLGDPGWIGDETAWTYDTPSNVGSISKTWTALAAMRLSELGYLDIDDPITDYLPEAGVYAGITIKQLLSHTSGIKRDPSWAANLDTDAELEGLFPGVDHPGMHPRLAYFGYKDNPGITALDLGDASYSNVGYMLLGAIVDIIAEANAGELGNADSYEKLVWRHVGLFDGNVNNPNQMISGCLLEDWRGSADHQKLAVGYRKLPVGFEVEGTAAQEYGGPEGWEGPAGGWNMAVGDLVRLMIAIQQDAIVSPATKAEMTTIYADDSAGKWGLGFNRKAFFSRPTIWHDGAYPGYRARYTLWPDEDFGVAVMCNNGGVSPEPLSLDIAGLFLGGGIGGSAPQADEASAEADGTGIQDLTARRDQGPGRRGRSDGDTGRVPRFRERAPERDGGAAPAGTTTTDDPGLGAEVLSTPVTPPRREITDPMIDDLVNPSTKCNGYEATIVGTEGDDTIVGTPLDDVIVGLGGNDTILGLEGNDVICGGLGADWIVGGAGHDELFDEDDGNLLEGGEGNDTLGVDGSTNTLEGGPGNDLLGANGRFNELKGGDGDDSLAALGDDNELWGEGGRDTIVASGNGRLAGGPDDDWLRATGSTGATLTGGPGNDVLEGSDGDDVLDGGTGDDRILGGPGMDTVTGGPGNDRCDAGAEEQGEDCEQAPVRPRF